MRFLILILVFGAFATAPTYGQEMKCGIKTCFIELFTIHDITFSTIIQKAHTIAFCVRECSPPAVSELFQSLTYILTKSIPGVCAGKDCIEKNRFVGLAHCLENNTWPMVECGMKLMQLMQMKFEKKQDNHRNKTCDVIIESVMCFEKSVKRCGPKVYSLLEGAFLDAVEAGVNIYCERSYKEGGIAVTVPEAFRTTTEEPFEPTYEPLKPVAKGYRHRRSPGAGSRLQLPSVWLIGTIGAVIPIMNLRFR